MKVLIYLIVVCDHFFVCLALQDSLYLCVCFSCLGYACLALEGSLSLYHYLSCLGYDYQVNEI